jgi:DNA polymerase-3 subunit beta
VLELQGLFETGDGTVDLEFGRNHLRVRRGDVTFTSKLIDGRFPDYEAVIPIGADKQVRLVRDQLRSALQRAAILSNEKYRGVKLEVSPNKLRIVAHNPEQEEAVEELEAKTGAGRSGCGLQRQLSARRAQCVARRRRADLPARREFELPAAGPDSEQARHVIMPLRL